MASRESRPTAAVATEQPAQAAEAPVYHLHLQPRAHVTFDESVVDNEHLGRKKSNSEAFFLGYFAIVKDEKMAKWTGDREPECCIFHKKREFGESSSESGEDDSDDEHGHDHDHSHGRGCQHKKKRCPRPKRPVSPSSSDDEQKTSA